MTFVDALHLLTDLRCKFRGFMCRAAKLYKELRYRQLLSGAELWGGAACDLQGGVENNVAQQHLGAVVDAAETFQQTDAAVDGGKDVAGK